MTTAADWPREALHRAARAHPCTRCGRPAGLRCVTLTGAVTAPHAPRIALAVDAADQAPTCPRLAPESDVPCRLPDLPAWHIQTGHMSAPVEYRPGVHMTVGWPAFDPTDRARWDGAA